MNFNYMIRSSLLLFTLLLFSFTQAQDSITTPQATRTILVVPVSGTVDAGMAAFIERAIKEARQYKDPIIILEMDTFGGEVDAAFKIVDTMVNAPGTTIAYVKTKAISAGALIALSCGKLVMRNSTTIGDVAPLMVSNDGPKMLGEKFQSPIRAKFRTLAKKNGYPEGLTDAMVTTDLAVYQVKLPDTTLYLDSVKLADLDPAFKKKIISTKTVVRKGELLTMDDIEAKNLGFSKMSVENFEMLLEKFGFKGFPVIKVKESWSEKLVRFIATIAPILMIIGFGALYIEYKMPHSGLFAIIGIICLGVVFFGQYMVGLANYTELLFLIFGILLLGAEVFIIPGFGIAGIAGITCLVVGLILSMQDFVIPVPSKPWQMGEFLRNILQVFGSFIVAFIGGLLVIRYVFPKIRIAGASPYLMASLENFSITSDTTVTIKLGDIGTTITPLRPAGKAEFDNATYDVVTEGDFIDRKEKIIIRQITGNRIIVAKESHVS